MTLTMTKGPGSIRHADWKGFASAILAIMPRSPLAPLNWIAAARDAKVAIVWPEA